jgi:catechol 2,3-dioxygenase-like lactoylglutathione lyase family enzyme
MSHLPSFEALDHLGVTVPDLEQAVAFFVDVLGAQDWYREGPSSDEGDAMSRELRVHPRASVRLAMLKLGSTTTLELLEYKVPPGEASAAPPRNSDHSAAHIGLRVRDIDAAAAHLSTVQGVELLEGPVAVDGGPSDGLKWLYFVTPWGLMMELVQLPAGMVV